jgi:hypothetical protein
VEKDNIVIRFVLLTSVTLLSQYIYELAITIYLSNLYDAQIVNERVGFKIYSCKKHLVNLKLTKSTYEDSHKSKHEVCEHALIWR